MWKIEWTKTMDGEFFKTILALSWMIPDYDNSMFILSGFSKTKKKHCKPAFPKHLRFFMPLSEFSIERLADLSISMYHEFCWNPFEGNWHNAKVLHFAFRSQHGPENRVSGGWQESFWVAQDVNLSTTIDGCPFCTSWGWFFIPLRTGVFYIKDRWCKILFAINKTAPFKGFIYDEKFHEMSTQSNLRASVYGIFCPRFSRFLWDQCR